MSYLGAWLEVPSEPFVVDGRALGVNGGPELLGGSIGIGCGYKLNNELVLSARASIVPGMRDDQSNDNLELFPTLQHCRARLHDIPLLWCTGLKLHGILNISTIFHSKSIFDKVIVATRNTGGGG